MHSYVLKSRIGAKKFRLKIDRFFPLHYNFLANDCSQTHFDSSSLSIRGFFFYFYIRVVALSLREIYGYNNMLSISRKENFSNYSTEKKGETLTMLFAFLSTIQPFNSINLVQTKV